MTYICQFGVEQYLILDCHTNLHGEASCEIRQVICIHLPLPEAGRHMMPGSSMEVLRCREALDPRHASALCFTSADSPEELSSRRPPLGFRDRKGEPSSSIGHVHPRWILWQPRFTPTPFNEIHKRCRENRRFTSCVGMREFLKITTA